MFQLFATFGKPTFNHGMMMTYNLKELLSLQVFATCYLFLSFATFVLNLYLQRAMAAEAEAAREARAKVIQVQL